MIPSSVRVGPGACPTFVLLARDGARTKATVVSLSAAIRADGTIPPALGFASFGCCQTDRK
jgi:hypothetical protein